MKTFGLLWHFVNKFSFHPRRTPRPYGEHLVVRFKEDSLERYKAVSRVTSGRMHAGAACSSMSMSRHKVYCGPYALEHKKFCTDEFTSSVHGKFLLITRETEPLSLYSEQTVKFLRKHCIREPLFEKIFKVINTSANFDSMNISHISIVLVKRAHYQ